MKGTWIGKYKFDNEFLQKSTGFDWTNFEIEINSADNNNFEGTVTDDLNTGGTEGVGNIVGTIHGDKVEFVKRMPILTAIIDTKGTRKTFNRKHKKLYYSGVFSEGNKVIQGKWKFKFGFIWYKFMPIPVMPIKGSWIMKLKE